MNIEINKEYILEENIYNQHNKFKVVVLEKCIDPDDEQEYAVCVLADRTLDNYPREVKTNQLSAL